MDQADNSSTGNVVVKVSVVDESGRILLDTLVNPEVEINRSLVKLHGIKKKWLYDAPTLNDVRAYATKMFSKCVFIGHSVVHDLKCFGISSELRYADTSYFED